jgi:hypothetical protein
MHHACCFPGGGKKIERFAAGGTIRANIDLFPGAAGAFKKYSSDFGDLEPQWIAKPVARR